MIDERKGERRSNVDRRQAANRRSREDEWFPAYGVREFEVSDRRSGERRGLDRRKPD